MAFVLLFNKIFEYKKCCNSTKMVSDGQLMLRVYYICIKTCTVIVFIGCIMLGQGFYFCIICDTIIVKLYLMVT